MIIWAGTSTKDVGMVVEHYPSIIIPQKNQEVQVVPGRNGNIVIPNGSFANYEQSYQVFLDAKYIGKLEQVMPKVSEWLLGNDGYQRLEDSYFPDFYRLAYYSGGTEFVSFFNEYGEGTLTFNCAPEKYYKYGDFDISLENGVVLKNPTVFPAKPTIRITPSGTSSDVVLTFTTDGTANTFTIKSGAFDYGTVGIDVKDHRAFHGTTNLNRYIEGTYENIVLKGQTTITWTGNVSRVLMRPRWWTI